MPLRFLALGDSYTIGESVSEAERWPVLLVEALMGQGFSFDPPEIIARTGWTTGELSSGIDAAELRPPYQLVTLMIGVNNQYRGYSKEEYRQEFAQLLTRAVAFAGGDPGRVLVASIPDWSVTPYAGSFDRERVSNEIDAFNDVNRQEAERLGARYVDVTPLSRRAATEPDLIAMDGLHPSGKMYSTWITVILPVALVAMRKS
jgi:lysophospholipase L1-like esterase